MRKSIQVLFEVKLVGIEFLFAIVIYLFVKFSYNLVYYFTWFIDSANKGENQINFVGENVVVTYYPWTLSFRLFYLGIFFFGSFGLFKLGVPKLSWSWFISVE